MKNNSECEYGCDITIVITRIYKNFFYLFMYDNGNELQFSFNSLFIEKNRGRRRTISSFHILIYFLNFFIPHFNLVSHFAPLIVRLWTDITEQTSQTMFSLFPDPVPPSQQHSNTLSAWEETMFSLFPDSVPHLNNIPILCQLVNRQCSAYFLTQSPISTFQYIVKHKINCITTCYTRNVRK